MAVILISSVNIFISTEDPTFLKVAPIVPYSGTMVSNNGTASIPKIPMADHYMGTRDICYSKVYDHDALKSAVDVLSTLLEFLFEIIHVS
jgi:hypothetical protein